MSDNDMKPIFSPEDIMNDESGIYAHSRATGTKTLFL